MVYYDPRKPKPWPIRLMNKIGIEDDSVATRVVIGISLLFFAISLFQLVELNSSPEDIDRTLTPEERAMLGL